MWHELLFSLLLLATCVYALALGGAPERITAALMIVAVVLTILVQRPSTLGTYYTVDVAAMAVDVGFLFGLLALAVASARFWPVWEAGLQLVYVVSHVVRAIDPRLMPKGYVFIMAFWSYPMVLILAAGVYRHRQRLHALGADPAWKPWFSDVSAGDERPGDADERKIASNR